MTRPPPPSSAGFTLVELLAALLVLAFVIAMLTQGLQFGAHAARLAAGEHTQDLLAVDQALRRVIGLADPGIYPEPATLRGGADRLALTTDLPSGGSGPPQRADVVLFAADGRLLLRWRPHRHADGFGPRPAWTDTVVLDEVDHVEFSYAAASSGAGWFRAWTGERLPADVKLAIRFTKRSGRHWPPLVVATLQEPMQE